MIKPEDLISRLGVDGLCVTAEKYYAGIKDTSNLKLKPFNGFDATPFLLVKLGYLLSDMHLAKGMTVLDFGAGTCWISNIMTQMGCYAIAVDPSVTALNIGREICENNWGSVPTFLEFNGRNIEMPSESVDRILCFDAFHHVPNPEEILSELYRVLKPGGILGFSEPVGDHSDTKDSQHEMNAYQVLENDIDLPKLMKFGRSIGFSEVTFKCYTSPEFKMDPASRNRILHKGPKGLWGKISKRLKKEIFHVQYNEMICHFHKGPLKLDSRHRDTLGGELSLDHKQYRIDASEGLVIQVSAKNTGSGMWLSGKPSDIGTVKLGAHLYDQGETLLNFDFCTRNLPRNVDAGEVCDFEMQLPLLNPGAYRVELDLVAEGVSWFQRCGLQTVNIEIVVDE